MKIGSRNNYCKNCGLMYRLWIHKAELEICDECEPEKFAKLHKENIRVIKKRTRGQQHITEHTFFPSSKRTYAPMQYRRETK